MFDDDIEEELDSFDFEEDCFFHTRKSMGELLTKQKNCEHEFYTVGTSQGNVATGQRCEICGYQEWF